jgi:pimeloyl-ACP methyl ester carboxylesterase
MIWPTQKLLQGPERRRQPRWRPRPLRVILASLVIAVIGYGAAVLYLVSQKRARVSGGPDAQRLRPAFPSNRSTFPGQMVRIVPWIMPELAASPDAPWVLFFHGNAATIAARVNIAHYTELRKLGVSIMAPEYRGFGGLEGVPTEAALAVDARAAYDYLRTVRKVPASRLVIYGWSLGSAVAVTLASEVESAGLILEGAPASLVNIGKQQYPFFPVRLMMRNSFESIRRIDRVRAPMLSAQPGGRGHPHSEGRRLFDAARGIRRSSRFAAVMSTPPP